MRRGGDNGEGRRLRGGEGGRRDMREDEEENKGRRGGDKGEERGRRDMREDKIKVRANEEYI